MWATYEAEHTTNETDRADADIWEHLRMVGVLEDTEHQTRAPAILRIQSQYGVAARSSHESAGENEAAKDNTPGSQTAVRIRPLLHASLERFLRHCAALLRGGRSGECVGTEGRLRRLVHHRRHRP